MSTKTKYILLMIGSAVLLVAMACLALCLGQYRIPIRDVVAELSGRATELGSAHSVLFNVRIPRILLSMISGAGLSVAGLAFQCMFGNPLASPDTLGTANGASFGAALGLLIGLDSFGVQLSALVFGIVAVALVFLVTKGITSGKTRSMTVIILAGMVISSLFSALVSLVKYVADPEDELPAITFWLMGSFSSVTRKGMLLAIPLIAGGVLVIFLLRFRLNGLSLSEDEARGLTRNLPLVRGLVIVSASAITASVVSVCGLIGWVGLLVPHMVRMVLGNDNRRAVPACILMGALFMLVIDTVARCATQSEIPVSILTAIIGAPIFILLLQKSGGIRS
ncbi:MAG: FecCD family ABC transporter permease [Lachnospiraceae bacterium]